MFLILDIWLNRLLRFFSQLLIHFLFAIINHHRFLIQFRLNNLLSNGDILHFATQIVYNILLHFDLLKYIIIIILINEDFFSFDWRFILNWLSENLTWLNRLGDDRIEFSLTSRKNLLILPVKLLLFLNIINLKVLFKPVINYLFLLAYLIICLQKIAFFASRNGILFDLNLQFIDLLFGILYPYFLSLNLSLIFHIIKLFSVWYL